MMNRSLCVTRNSFTFIIMFLGFLTLPPSAAMFVLGCFARNAAISSAYSSKLFFVAVVGVTGSRSGFDLFDGVGVADGFSAGRFFCEAGATACFFAGTSSSSESEPEAESDSDASDSSSDSSSSD